MVEYKNFIFFHKKLENKIKKTKMFIVVSFDFGGTSNQCIHCLNNNYDKAFQIYKNLIETLDIHKSDKGCGHIVELLEISESYENTKGYCFYWPSEENKKDTGVKVMRTTSE